jgi:hypothetical protein
MIPIDFAFNVLNGKILENKINAIFKINFIIEKLNEININELLAPIELLKISLQSIAQRVSLDYTRAINNLNITKLVKYDLREVRKLSILAFNKIYNISDKLIATKIIIIASVFLYYDNSKYLELNIHSALKRLLDLESVRSNLVYSLKLLVIQSYLIIKLLNSDLKCVNLDNKDTSIILNIIENKNNNDDDDEFFNIVVDDFYNIDKIKEEVKEEIKEEIKEEVKEEIK